MRHVVELGKSWDSSSLGFLYAPDNLWSPERSFAAVGTAHGAVLNARETMSPYHSTTVRLHWLNASSCEPHGDSSRCHGQAAVDAQQVPWASCG
jgi:hypothetical protein